MDAALWELEKIRDQASLDLSTLDQGAGTREMKVEEEEQTEEGKLPCGEEVLSEATEIFMPHSEVHSHTHPLTHTHTHPYTHTLTHTR